MIPSLKPIISYDWNRQLEVATVRINMQREKIPKTINLRLLSVFQSVLLFANLPVNRRMSLPQKYIGTPKRPRIPVNPPKIPKAPS